MFCRIGPTVDMNIRTHAFLGVIDANVIDSAMIDVTDWKNTNCRVNSSIGLRANVLCAFFSHSQTMDVPFEMLSVYACCPFVGGQVVNALSSAQRPFPLPVDAAFCLPYCALN
jgi:hypothetical protein